ncbi:MAG: glutaredoxin family protein [Chloroflexi bacterium]|nr:glutaredoxin family protein [Chloroflexota bacterium]
MLELELFVKPGCHLCQEAAALLRRLQRDYAFSFQEVDINRDPALREEYGDIIPVVEVSGRPLLAAPFGEASARKALERLLRSTP